MAHSKGVLQKTEVPEAVLEHLSILCLQQLCKCPLRHATHQQQHEIHINLIQGQN